MENSIDVIIPTILFTDIRVFGYLLLQLQEADEVNQIVVIDNTEKQEFKEKLGIVADPIMTPKLTVINGHKIGCYVNGAWQRGILHTMGSRAKYYCLINDDIVMHKYVMHCCASVMEQDPKVSLVTVKTVNNVPINAYLKNYDGGTEKVTEKIPNGRQGWFMFGRKKQWKSIPPQLKIFYGDDWIYRQAKKVGKVVMIQDPIISHFQSSSVNKNMDKIRPIIKQDELEWIELHKRGQL